jgi:NAD(P)-dependent dehydrogenase (short-subunit alcohol dehydrogenase family)
MDLGLKGKRAIITGGSDGVGLAIAQALAREGCNVAIGARGRDKLDTAVDGLKALGVDAHGITADFSTAKGCDQFVADAAAALGGIDILVNNVGGMTPGSIESLSDEDWAKSIDINLMSYIRTARAALPHIRKSDMGRILNVSGLSGTQLLPGAWSTTIGNTAIHGLTKQLAQQCGAENITVNAICPGTVRTAAWMGPRAEAMGKATGKSGEEVRAMMASFAMLNRLAEPEEIGDTAAYLVSAKNSYMTGTTVEVCGGWAKYIG